uniref:Noggin n=1 Tax=Stegastes partitus TaxID=144197 RepID=A0A3B5A6F2_9TELE
LKCLKVTRPIASLPSYSQPIRPYSLLPQAEDYFYMPKPRHRRPSRLLRLLGPSFDPFWMSIDQPSEKEAAELDLSSLPSDVSNSVRSWLVRSATCDLHYRWVDLGPTFWPRWLRQTDCEQADGEKSCSFPGGMKCVRAQTTHIKILAWHCEALKRCLWRQIPYPVVTVCVCSC